MGQFSVEKSVLPGSVLSGNQHGGIELQMKAASGVLPIMELSFGVRRPIDTLA